MTPTESLPIEEVSTQTLFTELFSGPYEQSQRVAKGYARRIGRGGDLAFVDECQAEASFILVELIWSAYAKILEKYPEEEDRHKFYRMSVGYKLKEYWAYRSTSTISYLKKKGIVEHHYSLSAEQKGKSEFNDGMTTTFSTEHVGLARMNIEVELYILLDSVCLDEVERLIVDLYAIGNTKEEIGVKLEMSPARVKKTLRRIKRRIRHSGDE